MRRARLDLVRLATKGETLEHQDVAEAGLARALGARDAGSNPVFLTDVLVV